MGRFAPALLTPMLCNLALEFGSTMGYKSYLTSKEVEIGVCGNGMVSTLRSVQLSVSECPSVPHMIWRKGRGHVEEWWSSTFSTSGDQRGDS
jgi:hypothetical protein